MSYKCKMVLQDKLPVLLWTITQACQGDLVVGLLMWVHLLLPILTSNRVVILNLETLFCSCLRGIYLPQKRVQF
ncbi:hypothetical protein L2E82_14815 [Cichorium intybus]|uniref:Uncharacterized protein n=1 Tax=Cichorium intybus TaxID=13427 RepID=A0ACB9F0H0_CICIN|nr:hypothetical protein L2E82_14815 [Cichorium intybus]